MSRIKSRPGNFTIFYNHRTIQGKLHLNVKAGEIGSTDQFFVSDDKVAFIQGVDGKWKPVDGSSKTQPKFSTGKTFIIMVKAGDFDEMPNGKQGQWQRQEVGTLKLVQVEKETKFVSLSPTNPSRHGSHGTGGRINGR